MTFVAAATLTRGRWRKEHVTQVCGRNGPLPHSRQSWRRWRCRADPPGGSRWSPVSRRQFLQTASGLLLWGAGGSSLATVIGAMPKSAAAVTSEAGAALVPVVRVYDALDDLVTVIESLESTAALRRTIKLLLTGNRLRQNVRKAADLALPIGPVHDEALRHGLDAAEYLSQTVAYYDTLLGKLPRDARQFAVQAIKACKQELRLFLQAFPDDDVERARRTVYVLDVASFESM